MNMIFPRHTFYIYLLDKSYHTVKEKQHTTLLIKDIRARRLLKKKKKKVILLYRAMRNNAAHDFYGGPLVPAQNLGPVDAGKSLSNEGRH